MNGSTTDSEGGAITLSLTIDQLRALDHAPLGRTDWRLVTQTMIDDFARAAGDSQWIHVDVERARRGPFGAPIAHGYLLLSVVPILLKELLVVTDSVRGVNYGIDRVRFTTPVPVDSCVALDASVSHVRDVTDHGVIFAVEFNLQLRGSARPAVVGRTLYGVYADADPPVQL
ncbi:MaoC family dehydratase [uncultured Serinicoccus sp.]|uniref:MaoC family dehydratase n=1 Tax=uncultured Serinicoccus sp. TaxID=735514 RepID=UPI00345AB9B7